MKNLRLINTFLAFTSMALILVSCINGKKVKTKIAGSDSGNMRIGWASADITPDKPVLIKGQYHARVSEGVMDPITATVLAIESGTEPSSGKAILISCDLVEISNELTFAVKKILAESLPDINPEQIIIHATHTHTAPYCGADTDSKSLYGIELNAMSPSKCTKYISERIATAVIQAWKNRKPGGISFGLGSAVVGHNRLAVDSTGKSVIYGSTSSPVFSHLEGYEDHSVNLLYTWDNNVKLTGVIINIACPAQVSEEEFLISADYWNETRLEVRQSLGKDIYILPQCGAAGDQSPHVMFDAKAEARMQRLMGTDSIMTGDRSLAHRKQIAISIANAVTSVLPFMEANIEWTPVFDLRTEIVNLSRRLISVTDVNNSIEKSKGLEKKYRQLLLEINKTPTIKENPRWYKDITYNYGAMKRSDRVKDRFELEKVQPKMPVEVKVLRIGDIVIATNPFELYVDYGIRIKGRSPAVQTFLVQLAGIGTYLPPSRSVAGGSYGAAPASTLIGPEGGQELVEKTLELINAAWLKK